MVDLGWVALSFAGFIATCGATGVALAEPTSSSARLAYTREADADDCPDELGIKSAVASRLGYDPFQTTAPATVVVHVARADGHLVGRIALSDADGKVVGERNLASFSNDCNELTAAMALAISIAIDPLSLTRPQRAPLVVAPLTVQEPVSPAPSTTPTMFDLGVGALGSLGVAPNVAWGGILSASLRRGSLSLGIEGRADLTQVSTVPGGTISSSLFDGSVVPCIHYQALAACGVATFGALRAAGVHVVDPVRVFTPYVAFGARLEGELPVTSAVFVRARLDLLAPVTKTTFLVGGSPVWTHLATCRYPWPRRRGTPSMTHRVSSTQNVVSGENRPRVAQGDSARTAAEFRVAYEAEFSYVWHSLRRLGIRTGDLEDLTHDVFVIAYRRFEDYETSRPLRAWLFGIAFRVASDFRRRAGYRNEVGGGAPDAATEVPLQDQDVAANQDRQLVLECLEALEPDRRAVFVMHELGEHPIPEVAVALEIPLNTAYSRLRLARQDFAKAAQARRQTGTVHE
jgi:RNA polymerase sigma-70 factor, ECF subfamily